jgi:O-antigen/teichoic acid export membrane protein
MNFATDVRAPLPPLNESPNRSRYHRIAAAALSALFGKGTGLLVNAVTVPLTVHYLGSEGYGLWITISSAVTMFFVLDIGIANTLTNLISKAYAAADKTLAATYFATAFWLVVGVAALLGFAGWVLWPHLDWPYIFHIYDPRLAHDTSLAVGAAFVVFLFALPTSLVSKVLGGYQELHVANLFASGGSIASLLGILAVLHFRGGLPMLVGVYAGCAAGANVFCLFWICFFHKPWMKPWPSRMRRNVVGDIFHSGSQFFLIQIAGLTVFNSDNLIIAHYLSPAQVTPYNVTWRLASYITAVQALISPALWPAYSEAYTKGDLAWIRSAYARNRWVTIFVLTVGCGLMLAAGRRIIYLWAGPAGVPSARLLWLMCVWMVILSFTLNQSCLMGATNRMKKQAIFSILSAPANLALSIAWVKTMGVVGVLAGTIVTYLIFVVVIQAIEVRSILRGHAVAPRPKAAS